jgi:hypothetical protein
MKKILRTLASFAGSALAADQVFIEAESFKDHGGWSPDTQFIESMDSPYLLAHGMGERVKDAATTVNFPNAGKYRVWVRTWTGSRAGAHRARRETFNCPWMASRSRRPSARRARRGRGRTAA